MLLLCCGGKEENLFCLDFCAVKWHRHETSPVVSCNRCIARLYIFLLCCVRFLLRIPDLTLQFIKDRLELGMRVSAEWQITQTGERETKKSTKWPRV